MRGVPPPSWPADFQPAAWRSREVVQAMAAVSLSLARQNGISSSRSPPRGASHEGPPDAAAGRDAGGPARPAAGAGRPPPIGGSAMPPAYAPELAAALAPVQHGQLAVEPADHDLGRITLLAALIGPFAGLQRALDVDLGALFQILLGHVGDPVVEDHDAMPLGAFLPLPRLAVVPGLAGRQSEIDDLAAVLGIADFGSRPRLPTRITLLTLPAIAWLPS